MMELKDFIKIYHNVMPLEMCDSLIVNYDISSKITHNNDVGVFSEVNINQHSTNRELIRNVTYLQTAIFNHYRQEIMPFTMPNPTNYEEYRVKRYDVGGKFDWHIDVADHNSARRYLAFLWYLSDNKDTGKTVFFKDTPLEFTPQKGSVLVFPPLWLFPHKGSTVEHGHKYIMSSYLHY